MIVPVQDDSRCVLHTSLSETIEPLVKTLPQVSSSLFATVFNILLWQYVWIFVASGSLLKSGSLV